MSMSGADNSRAARAARAAARAARRAADLASARAEREIARALASGDRAGHRTVEAVNAAIARRNSIRRAVGIMSDPDDNKDDSSDDSSSSSDDDYDNHNPGANTDPYRNNAMAASDDDNDRESVPDLHPPPYTPTPAAPRAAPRAARPITRLVLAPPRVALPAAPAASPAAAAPTPGPAAVSSRTPSPLTPFVCQDCGRTYNTLGPLKQHMDDRHCGTRCYFPGCTITTHTEEQLLFHFRDHQQEGIDDGMSTLACPWPGCSKSFSRTDTVQRCIKKHNRRAHAGEN
ncbi:hypothetical protein F4823DRAFT_549818 [Ustulina deusta]|nr:hypothetical protein F4823DRAFT_549818 [Ustulina deusta]